jgi:exodeoxyribonuclease VII large subunit
VQGSYAAKEIAAGIKALDAIDEIDIIIIGRGGGSPEDLWAFNEEVVVRAVAECKTPMVSAVGHEVDVSLSDLAADLRAPTPSAAAELCLPDKLALEDRLSELKSRMQRSLKSQVESLYTWLKDRAVKSLDQSILSRWREESQRLDELSRRLNIAARTLLERNKAKLDHWHARHAALNPTAVLARGYSVVRLQGQMKPITTSAVLTPDDMVDITFHQGSAEAAVKRCRS